MYYLSEAQRERLALLIEECAEVQQAATKVLRHGFHSVNPHSTEALPPTNTDSLERELGHLRFAIDLLLGNGDVRWQQVDNATATKRASVSRWLHHSHTIT